MKYELVEVPDERLRMISENVELSKIQSTEFQEFLTILQEMMLKYDGGGLSAIQIGVTERVFVVNTTVYGGSAIEFFINPLVKQVGSSVKRDFDGCLSVPGYYGHTVRPKKVKVVYYNSKGERIKGIFSGMIARTIHHELDHLNGVLWIDRVDDFTTLKKDGRSRSELSLVDLEKLKKTLE